MKYDNICCAKFVLRKNRFIAEIEIGGKVELCHVKNTGRLGELLYEGAEIFVQKSKKAERKTAYDLIGVVADGKTVNIDSLAPNAAVGEYLHRAYPDAKIVPERKYGNSRFDFYMEKGEEKGFIEVKGVTLFRDGYALFPDAPTERGIKHLLELCECVKEGFFAKVFFVICADSGGKLTFAPNRALGEDFADALVYASTNGVEVCAFDCRVGADYMEIKDSIKVEIMKGRKTECF